MRVGQPCEMFAEFAHPQEGQVILYGHLVSRETAFEETARQFLLAETVRDLHRAGVAETGGGVG